MQSLAEWKFGSCNVGDKKKKKKQRVNLEPPRPMAARLTRRSFRSYNRACKIYQFADIN